MRIISVRVLPVATILATAYAFLGFAAFAVYAVSRTESLTLPFGILMPLFHLDLTLNLPRSSGVFYNVLLCVAAGLSYAITGWITGLAAAFCFNAVAKHTGGIDAKYVVIGADQAPASTI